MVQGEINYCEEIKHLPVIPNEVLKDLKTIETYKDLFSIPNFSDTYCSYEANQELINFLENYFDSKIQVRYQVIKKALPIHIDKVKLSTKLNYLLDTGGDVKTRWWTSVDEPREMLFEYSQKVNTWYKLNIQIPHDISAPSNFRVSVTVKEV